MVNEINGVMIGERRKKKTKKPREKNREDKAGVRNNIPGLDPQKIFSWLALKSVGVRGINTVVTLVLRYFA